MEKTFDWTHVFHRSLYDLFASDKVKDKEAAYKKLLTDYLEKPEAITPHRLDHHGVLWSFPESKSFRDRFAVTLLSSDRAFVQFLIVGTEEPATGS